MGENFTMSVRKFLKEVGVTSQQQLEQLVQEKGLSGTEPMRVKIVLTAEGTDLHHVVEGKLDLSDA